MYRFERERERDEKHLQYIYIYINPIEELKLRRTQWKQLDQFEIWVQKPN